MSTFTYDMPLKSIFDTLKSILVLLKEKHGNHEMCEARSADSYDFKIFIQKIHTIYIIYNNPLAVFLSNCVFEMWYGPL